MRPSPPNGAVARLVIQMRADAANGVHSTQPSLMGALDVRQASVSETLAAAIDEGYVQLSRSRAKGPRKTLKTYELTEQGRTYADQQTRGAGP